MFCETGWHSKRQNLNESNKNGFPEGPYDNLSVPSVHKQRMILSPAQPTACAVSKRPIPGPIQPSVTQSDQFQISPAASREITSHCMKNLA